MNEGLQLLRQMLPYLAGRLTLAEFTVLALALGAERRPSGSPRRRPAAVPLGVDPRALLPQVLQEEKGNISAAARRLHVSTKTIYRWLAKSGKDIVEIRANGPS
jgi:DNA-binding NtrC family response regulator